MGSALAGESFTISRYRPALGRTVSPGSAGLQMSTHQKHMATQGHSEQDLKPGSAHSRALALSHPTPRFPLCSEVLANAAWKELRGSYCQHRCLSRGESQVSAAGGPRWAVGGFLQADGVSRRGRL